MLFDVVLNVLDLDIKVEVVTACAEDLLDVQCHNVCSRCKASCCPSSSACCTVVLAVCESFVVLKVIVLECTRHCSSFDVVVLLCTRCLRRT